MARTDIPYIKSRFETGDRPDGKDYEDLIDTLAGQSTDLGTAGNNENVIYGIENQTTIDSFKASEWRMVKYLVSISKITDGDNKFYATELSILIDGQNLNVSEYGTLDNDGDMGTINVSRSGDMVNLIVTPNSNIRPVTVRYARIGLKA
jgi:hypothetical protein